MAVFNKPQFNSVWAATGTKVDPGVAKIGVGWVVEIPPHEYANWLENRRDAMLAHLNQAGVPTWDSTVEYQANKSYVQGTSTGVIYRCLVTNTGVNPELDIQGNWEVAFQRSGEALLKSQNLADVPDKAQARTNLGIATTADYDARYLIKSQNLADVPNKATARGNLGLGNSATTNVGTSTGTVAAGNDSRIVNAVQTSRALTAGNGLVGGGNLSADRTISLGTPSSITHTSGNTVSATTHSHFINIPSLFPFSRSSSTTVPVGDFLMKFGTTASVGDGGNIYVAFPEPFPSSCVNIQLTQNSGITVNAQAGHVVATEITRFGFRMYWNATENRSASCMYMAVGW